jgi:hypothetical protein
MDEKKLKPDSSGGSKASHQPDLKVLKPNQKEYSDPTQSDRRGFAGFFETALRRFKNAIHIVLTMPLYAVGCIMIGVAAAPGVATFEYLTTHLVASSLWLHYLVIGFSLGVSYFAYGFSLLFVAPTMNFILRTNLKPWRGPYYSLEAIRWFFHNGATYLARYTFLEFVTPSPFNILFYRMMGMKIGPGSTINSTWISDPSLIELGEKVTIGGSVTLVGHYGQGGYLVLARTKIGNRVTIGLKATIMGGVTIGDGAKVLPNSVVMPKTEIPASETWGGVPARKIDF